jgi:hypothetical protein
MKIKNFLRTQLLRKKTLSKREKKKHIWFNLMLHSSIHGICTNPWLHLHVVMHLVGSKFDNCKRNFCNIFESFLWNEFQKFCYDFFNINVFWCLKSLLTWFHSIICTHKLKFPGVWIQTLSTQTTSQCIHTKLENRMHTHSTTTKRCII